MVEVLVAQMYDFVSMMIFIFYCCFLLCFFCFFGNTQDSPSKDDMKSDAKSNDATPGGAATSGGDEGAIAYPNLSVVSNASESRAFKKLEQFYAAYNPAKLQDRKGTLDDLVACILVLF